MFQRTIQQEDVELVIKQGFVIETYDNDSPLPSLLLNGKTRDGKPLHVVLVVNIEEFLLVVVTVYRPDSDKWTKNYARRL
jgi:hypothetical protein